LGLRLRLQVRLSRRVQPQVGFSVIARVSP